MKEKNLSKREIQVLSLLCQKDLTSGDLEFEFNLSKAAIHHLIRSLRLKELIHLVGEDESGNHIYGIIES